MFNASCYGIVRRVFCCSSDVNAGASVSLITAALDLSVVRLIRGAVSANLVGKPGPLGTVVRPVACRRIATRFVHHPDPRIEPRRTISPTPNIEPRQTIHPRPSVAPVEVSPVVVAPSDLPTHEPSVLPPPWLLPLWQTPLPPTPIVKLSLHRPDTRHKGTLLDRFA
jgi:hypothetical protein